MNQSHKIVAVKTVWLIALLLFHCSAVYGFNSDLKFRSMNAKDGLSQDAVTAMLEDEKGFMWFGTYNGLNRYDGYEFKIFRHSSADTTSISNNVIYAMCLDDNGYLWLGTYGGLNRLDLKTEKSIQFLHDENNPNSPSHDYVTSMFNDNKGKIWCGTFAGGVFSVDVNTLEFERYLFADLPGFRERSNSVYEILPAKDGWIWVATRGDGLLKLQPKSKKVKQYLHYDPNYSTENSDIRNIHVVNDTLLLVNTNDQQLMLFNTVHEEFIPIQDAMMREFKRQNINIHHFTEGKNGYIWIATLGFGAYYYNPMTHDYRLYIHEHHNPHSLLNNRVLSLYENKAGILWVGTSRGISYFDPHYRKMSVFSKSELPEQFTSSEVFHFIQMDEEHLLVNVYGNGLIKFNTRTKTFSEPPAIFKDKALGKNYRSLLLTSKGEVLIGDNNSFIRINSDFRDKKIYQYDHDHRGKRPIFATWFLMEDSRGNAWIGTDAGAQKFDLEKDQLKLYSPNPDSIRDQPENLTWAICEDHEGYIWIGTDGGGLCQLDPVSEKFLNFYTKNEDDTTTISNNRIISLLADSKNRLWVGTSSGINLFDRKTKTFRSLSGEDGLTSDVVFSILEGNGGEIWFATSKTIVELDPETWEFREFGHIDGVQENEFGNNSCYKLETGELLFGGLGGFNMFHPDSLKINNTPPEVVVTNMNILNKPIAEYMKESGKDIADKSFPYADSVFLSYQENSVSFNFAALNFSLSEKNQYAYILEGFDQEWLNVGTNRTAIYTNLPPGEFTFKVKACNNDGVWNHTGTSVYVFIKPPFWKLPIARLLFILGMVSGILLLIRLRTYRLNHQKDVLEKEVRARTRDLREVNALLQERQEEILSQKEEIVSQKEEIEKHRNNLEEIVQKRTSDLEIAKERAEMSEKLKSAFLANMSHEIRTPMNAIVGFSEMLGEKETTHEERNRFINIIRRNSNDLLFLINDTLDLSQIESGELTIRKEDFRLEDLMDDILEQYAVKVKEKGLELRRGYHPNNESFVHSDPHRVRQIVLNLLENAIKFTDKGYVELGIGTKHVDSKLSESEEFYTVFVKDSGIGIPKDKLEQVFERFRKFDDDPKKVYRGTGLGLAICNRLSKLLGGKIWVESELDQHSTFLFKLPASSPKVVKAYESEGAQFDLSELDWSKKRILVAEDETSNFEVIQSILKKTQVEIVWAKNGQEAFEIFNRDPDFDLGIIDIKMPIIDGFQLIKLLQDSFPRQKMPPMIAYTAFALNLQKNDFIEKGFDGYIYKPFKPKYLISLIQKLIAQN